MKQILLFFDSSVYPQLKIGYGSYLSITAGVPENLDEELIRGKIRVKRFISTSSSRLEIETLLWALIEIEKTIDKEDEIIVYTDSQNIMNLKDRRRGLEKNNYLVKRGGKYLKNSELYKKFYLITDRLNLRVTKVRGHSKHMEKDVIDKIFMQVDRASRKAVRKYIAERQSN